MRSFTKKLAGAMALSMVVSSLAPAGAVFADNVAYVAMQNSKAVVEEITVGFGSTIDFRFEGAPKNWRDLGLFWISDNTDVATVDKNGVVVTKDVEGEATITVGFANDAWTASVKVNVVKAERNYNGPVYVAYQNTLSKVTAIHVMKDSKIDLCFQDAPKDWKELARNWESEDEAIATVDQNGIVTGIADGKTKVSFVIGEQVATVDVTVGNYVEPEVEVPVVEDEFVVDRELTGICYDNQYYLDANEFTVGDTADLGVYYVAKTVNGETLVEDYTDIYVDEFTWKSSDDAVVTVENGVLTAVGAGTATITATGVVVDGYEETVEATITVKEAEVDESYTITQATDKQIVLTFADADVAATVTKDTVKMVKVRATGTTSFPISKVEVKDNKVTLTTYAAFGDGDKYIVTVGEAEGTEFTATLGYVDDIAVSYKSYEDDTAMTDSDGKAYANAEDESSITVKLSAQIFANDVDVTSAAGYITDEKYVEYEIEGDYDTDEVEIDENELTFYKAGVEVVVKATYIYEDAEEKEQVVEVLVPIVSEVAPAYKVEGIVDWTLVTADQEKIDWTKTVKDVPAGEEVYFVALVEDSYGNVYVTNSKYATDDYKALTDSKFEEEGYSLSYESTDVAKMIVDGNELKTWDKVTAGILVSLYNSETEKKEDIYCAEVKVKDARALASVTVNKDSITLPTSGDYTGSKVEIKLADQYGADWTNETEVVISAKASVDNKSVSLDDVKVKVSGAKYEYAFDGAQLKGAFGKAVTVKFTVKAGSKADNFEVVLKNPNADKVTYGLEAASVSQTVKNDDTSAIKAGTIAFYEYQSKLKVGKEETKLIASDGALDYLLNKATNKDVAKGDKFLVVYKPDGKVYAEVATTNALGVYDNGDGTYQVIVARATKSEVVSNDSLKMAYAATGTYTAKVIEVTGFNSQGIAKTNQKAYVADFKVTNEDAAVKVAKQTKLESEYSDVKDVIVDAIAFTKGGSEWTLTTDNIIAVDAIESSDYVVIKSVTVKVPVGVDGGIKDTYYEVTVPVKMTVKYSK